MNRQTILKNALSLSVLGCLLILAVGSTGNGGGGSNVDLNATVRFTGTQFVIQNKDSFDWTKVELEVNKGYTLKVDRMAAGQTYTVGAMQFAESDGKKFNPITYKPLNFTIWCETPKGKGFYYGSFK